MEIRYGFHRRKDTSWFRKQMAEEVYERPMKSQLGDVSPFLRVQELWGGRLPVARFRGLKIYI